LEAYQTAEMPRKRGPKKWVWDPPGRGVLQISVGGYRRPVHFLAKIAVFSKNGAI